ncbi:quinolinate synthase NadA [uncultured Methanomethylovorans sp.]|uniref:quinolinate synthase NadA n=1 Tax=uncultured Methanomethylovorans sp. TaxID=183759 RepID=UPI002615D758|nr:quinolinate synthase NadA [uncultured Methanomethylovorans sp.]
MNESNMTETLQDRILQLKEKRNATILAHNYQVPEVQDIADIVGDSLELARAARSVECDVVVFCGVDFMAETACILNPEKTVLLPAEDACCPMASMITADEVRMLRRRFPDAAVVSYVNTTAEVKAESDICCTSSNAIKIVGSLEQEQVIFLPDKNLANYVARFSSKEILPWQGFCFVHDRITTDDVMKVHSAHPDAKLLVHPECRAEVIDLADHIFSTSGMIKHVCSAPDKEFIIGTEIGILHQLERKCPDKKCYPLSSQAVCTNMKRTDLARVCESLELLKPRITVPEEIANRARKAIKRMLAV